jgi:2'-5' RNA ligase
MRLFIAIELPEEVRRHLDCLITALKRDSEIPSISWVKRENWHITLKFLGEVEDARSSVLQTALASVAVEPMNLFVDRMIYFPKRGPVRVVAAGVGGDSGRLNKLQASIEATCEPLKTREDRNYQAHITFGRSRTGERGGPLISLRTLKLESLFPGPMFHVAHFVLMRSHLSNQGSKYEVVQRFD